MRTSTATVEVVPDRDDPNGVTVLLDGVPSSHLDLEDPTRLFFEYMQQMAVFLDHAAPAGEPLRVVHLGAAGCALARYVAATRPGSRQIAVDVDGELVRLVREWFDLPRSPGLRLRVGDARAQLATLGDASADVIVRDVFAPDVTPVHVTTAEFTADVRRVLAPGGLYLANCADRPGLQAVRSEVATISHVFPHVAATAEPAQLRGRRYGNVTVAATTRGDLLDEPHVARAVRSLPAPTRLLHGADLAALVGHAKILHDPHDPALDLRGREDRTDAPDPDWHDE